MSQFVACRHAGDGMPRLEWLCLLAVHSDAWLMSLAFFKGVRLGRDERYVRLQ